MNGVQTRFKCKLDVKRCKRFVFPPSSLLPRSNALKTKAIRYFQTDRTLTRIVSPPLYEAEWAYLPCYDDLGKKSKPIVYVPASDCSGRMKISRLGGREENFAEWSEVYSEKGGNYEMTIFYSCDKNRKLEVSVNGTKTVLKDLNSNNEVKSVTIPVSLKQGYNTVRMGNDFGWAPDIDRFTVSRQ